MGSKGTKASESIEDSYQPDLNLCLALIQSCRKCFGIPKMCIGLVVSADPGMNQRGYIHVSMKARCTKATYYSAIDAIQIHFLSPGD